MKRGFTLTELIFVISIVAVLAGIGIVQMTGSTQSALEAKAKGDLRNAVKAQQIYFSENGMYGNIPDELTYVPTDDKIEVRGEGKGANTENGRGFTLVISIEGVDTFCYDSSDGQGIVSCGVE